MTEKVISEEEGIELPNRDFLLRKHTKQTIYSRFHKHDYYEFFLLVDGELTESRGTSKLSLTKGDSVLIRPGDSHGYPEWRKEKFTFYNLTFRKSIWNELILLYPSLPWAALKNSEAPILTSMNNNDLQFCIYSLEWIFKMESPAQIHDAGLNFIARMAQQFWFSNLEKLQVNSPAWFIKTLNRFDDNRVIKEGIKYIKEEIYVSYEHFSRTFKRYMNITPAQYVKTRRTRTAKALLQRSDLTVSEISQECGYDNQSHFHHQFKSEYGISPLKYKKQLGV